MRAFPLLVALLLVCVAVGGGVTAAFEAAPSDAAPRPVPPAGPDTASARGNVDVASAPDAANEVTVNATNSTDVVNVSRILALPSGTVPATAIESVTIDAGIAVAFGTNASAARMETLALRERFRRADTAEARSQVILDGMNTVEQRAVSLRARHHAAIRAYADGGATATDLLVELARIRAEARALTERIHVLTSLAERVEGFSLNTARTQALLYDLETFGGPVTDRAAAALRGDVGPERMYVSAAGPNVVVTTVTDDEYVRETYRADLRRLDGSTIRPAVAQNVTARSYPEVWKARTATSGSGEGGTFIYEVAYPSGHLTTFVDGGTERVFKEYQRISLARFSKGAAVNNTQNGLTLAVNRTYAGGPLRISLVDAGTGEPVNATIRLGSGGVSTTVGRTGDDGVLWTLSPQGQYQVTAVQTDTASAAIVDTSAVDPETVAEAYGRGGPTGTGNGTETSSTPPGSNPQ